MRLIPRRYVAYALWFIALCSLLPRFGLADPDPNCYRKVTEAANGIAGQCSEINTITGAAKVTEQTHTFQAKQDGWQDDYPNEERLVAYSPVTCKLECDCQAQATALPHPLCGYPGVIEGVKDGERANACQQQYAVDLPDHSTNIMIREVRKKGTTTSWYEVSGFYDESLLDYFFGDGNTSLPRSFSNFEAAKAASAEAAAQTCKARAQMQAKKSFGPNGCATACNENRAVAESGLKSHESTMVCTRAKWEPIFPRPAACDPGDDASYRSYEVVVQNKGEGMVQMRGLSCPSRCSEMIRIPNGMTSVGTRITAQAMPGHRFVKWSGGSCDGSTANGCMVSLALDGGQNSITAVFQKMSHIRVTVDGIGGTASYDGDVPLNEVTNAEGNIIAYEGDVPVGSKIRVGASAKAEYKFGSWDIQSASNPCSSTGIGPSCSFEALATSYSITAQFIRELPPAAPAPAPIPAGPMPLPNTTPAEPGSGPVFGPFIGPPPSPVPAFVPTSPEGIASGGVTTPPLAIGTTAPPLAGGIAF